MEIDHESNNKELATRIIGLLHFVRLYEELGEYAFELHEELNHAAFTLAERIVLEIDV